MDSAVLQKQIASGELMRLYAFWGEEEYLKEHYLAEIIRTAVDGMREFNLSVFGAEGFDAARLSDALEAYPFMGGKKVAVLRNIDFGKLKKDALDTVKATLEDIPEYACVVAYFDADMYSPKERKKAGPIMDMAKKAGGDVEFKYPAQAQLTRWVARHFKSRGCDAAPEAVRRLVAISDGSMTSLIGEIEKLAALADGRAVTVADVDAVVVPSLESRIYAITDEMLGGGRRALDLINEQRLQKEQPGRVLALISTAMGELLTVKAALCAGESNARKIAEDAGVGPRREFLIKKYMTLARGIGAGALEQCLLLCEQAETDMKRSRMDEWIIVERAAAEMMLRLAAGRNA